MRRALATSLILAAACILSALVLLAGCDVDPGRPHANIPPSTILEVQVDSSEVDTTNYRTVLHWWGTDPDGEVVAYAYHWTGLWRAPADSARWSQDTTWVLTTATRDSFIIPIGGIYGQARFDVKAIDNHGEADPLGKHVTLKFRNSLPEVRWKTSPAFPDSSLPALTIAWGGFDPDGYKTIAYYRVWLEGDAPADAHIVPDTLYTLIPEDFTHHGTNTVYVQAVDESHGESAVIAHTWTVVEPHGQALLVDATRNNEPASDGSAEEFDAFYRAQLDTTFGAGNYSVLDLEHGGFRTAAEVGPTMSLFPVVLWYTGLSNTDPAREAAAFSRAASGIRSYVLDHGGSILITSESAAGTAGGFDADFEREVFGIQSFYADSLESTDLHVNRGTFMLPSPALDWADTLRTGSSFGGTISGSHVRFGVDFFQPTSTAIPLYFLPPHTLDGINRIYQDFDAYVGVLNQASSGGRAILLPFPMARADAMGNAGSQLRRQLLYLVNGSRVRPH